MILRISNDGHGEERPFAAWLEPEPGDKFLGLCVGTGKTAEEAEADAKNNLRAIIDNPVGYEHEC